MRVAFALLALVLFAACSNSESAEPDRVAPPTTASLDDAAPAHRAPPQEVTVRLRVLDEDTRTLLVASVSWAHSDDESDGFVSAKPVKWNEDEKGFVFRSPPGRIMVDAVAEGHVRRGLDLVVPESGELREELLLPEAGSLRVTIEQGGHERLFLRLWTNGETREIEVGEAVMDVYFLEAGEWNAVLSDSMAEGPEVSERRAVMIAKGERAKLALRARPRAGE